MDDGAVARGPVIQSFLSLKAAPDFRRGLFFGHFWLRARTNGWTGAVPPWNQGFEGRRAGCDAAPIGTNA